VRELLLIGVAGALGTLSRYALSGWAYRLLGERLPWGTLAVNVLGCFLLGLVMQVGLSTDALSRTARVAITVGFLGAFTTFSTFGYETMKAIEDGAWGAAGLNVALNLVVGFLAVAVGFGLARQVWGGA